MTVLRFVVIALVLAPLMVFLISGVIDMDIARWPDLLTKSFIGAMGRSLREAGILAAAGFALGWPIGTLCALQHPRGAAMLTSILVLPMTAPPFLWAIGVQNLRPLIPYANQVWLDGFPGVLFALAPLAVPLPLLTAWAAAHRLPASSQEAAWISGGRGTLLWITLRYTARSAAAGALLAGALVFADAGCDQIMGCHGFSSEVLIAFTAKNDFSLASAKALAGSLILLPAAIGIAWLTIGVPIDAPLGKAAIRGANRHCIVPDAALLVLLAMLVVVLALLPLYGLARPLLFSDPTSPYWENGWMLLCERLIPTLQRPFGAALTAVMSGTVICGLNRRVLLPFAMLTLALPSVFGSLGMVQLTSQYPWLLRPVQELGWLVGLSTGLRLAPLAALLISHARQRLPVSAIDAGRLAAVPPGRWWLHVMGPALAPGLLLAAAMASLISLGDMQAELLLQPAGGGSFGAHLFAVMDNSSDKTVAVLALLHLCGVWFTCILASAALWMSRRRNQ